MITKHHQKRKLKNQNLAKMINKNPKINRKRKILDKMINQNQINMIKNSKIEHTRVEAFAKDLCNNLYPFERFVTSN